MKLTGTAKTRAEHLASLIAIIAAGAVMTGCTGPASGPTPTPSSTTETTSYSSTSFVLPFDLELPEWAPPKPSIEGSNFDAWEAVDGIRKLRVMQPIDVYLPGETASSPLPSDFTSYLLSLGDAGVAISDKVSATVAGHPATVFTMDSTESYDGLLGCPTLNPCAFGPSPDLTLRIASINVDGMPLLMWLRTDADFEGTATASADFAKMLDSFTLVNRPVASATAAAGASLLDGVWTASYTREELAVSPLLLDGGEINDDNWGTETLTFAGRTLTQTMTNPLKTGTVAETFSVAGDQLTIETGSEEFIVRWKIDAGQLTLTRDPSLGTGPTPLVIKPFTLQ